MAHTFEQRGSARQRGFNLLELMITLVIAGVVLGFGIPSLTTFMANSRMTAAANDLVTSIYTARTEAVKRRQPVTVCASSNWDDANPDCDLDGGEAGWIVFNDVDGSVSVDGADTVIITHAPFPEGITLTIDDGALPYLQFAGSGFPQTADVGTPINNFLLCDIRGDISTGLDVADAEIAAGRWVAVSAAGRPQIYRRRDDVEGSPLGGC